MTAPRPLGTWVGSAGWHRQVESIAPEGSVQPARGIRVAVDEDLAPLLVAIWALGLPTTASCQNAPTTDRTDVESGEAHIHFATKDAARSFAELAGPDCIIYRPVRSGVSVAFPTANIEFIAAKARWMRALDT